MKEHLKAGAKMGLFLTACYGVLEVGIGLCSWFEKKLKKAVDKRNHNKNEEEA